MWAYLPVFFNIKHDSKNNNSGYNINVTSSEQLISPTEKTNRTDVNLNTDGHFFGSFVAPISQEQQNLQVCLSLLLYQTSAAALPPPPPPPLPVAPAQPSQSSACTTALREPQPAPSSWTSPTSGETNKRPSIMKNTNCLYPALFHDNAINNGFQGW